jgi:hypothetical protein
MSLIDPVAHAPTVANLLGYCPDFGICISFFHN